MSSRYSSPRGSTASDDAAYNGRMALDEVVAKLNDLDSNDGVPPRSRSGSKNGLVVNRLPFLSALFATNRSQYSDSILTDEEDRNQEDNPMLDIFLWRFPFVSAVWFVVSQVFCFLLFSGFSLVTLLAVLGLWQILTNFIASRLIPFGQKRGLINPELKIHNELRKHLFFNPTLVARAAGVIYEILDVVFGMWKITVMDANLGSVLVAFRILFVVFIRAFSVHTTLWLVVLAFFTIPVSYQGQKAVADLFADGVDFRKTTWKKSITAWAAERHENNTLKQLAATHIARWFGE